MQIILLLALVLPTPLDKVIAQEAPVKDTLDWRGYFPLQIGNQWQYRSDDFGYIYFTRWQILRDTLLNNRSYFIVDITGYDSQVQPINQLQRRDIIRYDSSNAHIVEWVLNQDGSPVDVWWLDIPCGLDAPFNARHECADLTTGQDYFVDGVYDTSLIVGTDTVQTAALKFFDSLGGGHSLAADLGLVARVVEGGSPITELVYANVDGTTYGEAAVPTISEEASEHPSHLAISSVYPNPFDSEATVAYHVSVFGRVTISVFDMLGRREHTHTETRASPGHYTTVIDGTGLSAGTYFVRLASPSGEQTTRLITHIH